MSEANKVEGWVAPIGKEAQASVSEAAARLDEVATLLAKWGRQPEMLNEVQILKGRLDRLLATMRDYRQEDNDG